MHGFSHAGEKALGWKLSPGAVAAHVPGCVPAHACLQGAAASPAEVLTGSSRVRANEELGISLSTSQAHSRGGSSPEQR